jgi:predicted secreted protein
MLFIGCDRYQGFPSSVSSPSSESSPLSESSPSSESLVSSNVDNGSSKQMKVGETFEVTLTENSTSGSEWELDEVNSSILYQVAEEYDEEYDYDPLRDSETCIGKTTMRFIAIRPGQTLLRLVHRQPEQMGALTTDSAINTFEINVMVEDNQ